VVVIFCSFVVVVVVVVVVAAVVVVICLNIYYTRYTFHYFQYAVILLVLVLGQIVFVVFLFGYTAVVSITISKLLTDINIQSYIHNYRAIPSKNLKRI
jgi:hypothetical protein